jgi:adenosine deaminase
MVTDRWLVALPKAEVHVHLEGSFDHDFVAAAAARAGMELPDRSQVHDLAQLLDYLDTACRAITDPGQLAELAYRFARREAGCGVRYADVIVNPSHWPAWAGRLPAFVAALDRGFAAAESDGLTPAGLCLSIARTQSSQAAMSLVVQLLALRHPRVVALSIDGNEAACGRTADRFAPAFDRAAAGGLKRTVHAGESSGPEGVWDAIDILGADRIDHGVRAADDDRLVAELALRRVPLGICPTSNVLLGIVTSVPEHPLDQLRRAGVLISLNTDDPALLGTDLISEYRTCAQAFGWSEDTLRAVARTSVEAAFASPALKSQILRDLEEFASATGPMFHRAVHNRPDVP